MYYRSEAIVLKSIDYRESEKIVTVFTEKEGKIRAVAKGTKKPNSSLRACIQPFVHASLYFSQGKNMDTITQGKVLDFYGNSREDLLRTLYCMYIMELLDKSMMDKIRLPGLFMTTRQVLERMDQYGYQPLLIRYFEMQLLVNLGYKPILMECASCGIQYSDYHCFSSAEGGVICDDCKLNSKGVLPLSGETLAVMRLLNKADLAILDRLKMSESAHVQLEYLLENYLEYHLERKFNLKNIIKRLKDVEQL